MFFQMIVMCCTWQAPRLESGATQINADQNDVCFFPNYL